MTQESGESWWAGLLKSRNFWLLAALGGRILQALLTGHVPSPGEAGLVAQNLAKGLGYIGGTWYGPSLAPSGLVPPVYPLFLTPVYYWELTWKVLWLVQAVVAALALIPVFRTARRLAGEKTALFCLAACALSPFLIKTSVIVNKTAWQTFFLAWAMEKSLSFILPLPGERKPEIFLTGICWGLAALTSADCAWYAVVVLGAAFIKYRKKELIGAGLVFIITIAPWSVWNSYRFGMLVPVSTAFGLNFWMGANDQATGSQYFRAGRLAPWPKILDESTDSLNEAEKYRLLIKEGIGWIKQHPLEYVKLRLKSAFYFWATYYQWADLRDLPRNPVTFGAMLGMLLLAAYGMVRAWNLPGISLILALFGAATLLYGLTHADMGDRYRLPLDPYLLFFAAYGVKEQVEKFASRAST